MLKACFSEWLDNLAKTPLGRATLINIYWSTQNGLVQNSTLKEFISACMDEANHQGEPLLSDPSLAIAAICKKDSSFHNICPVTEKTFDLKKEYSVTISSSNFHRHLLKKTPSATTITILPIEPLSRIDKDHENEYTLTLQRLKSNGALFAKGATLGKPFPDPRFVWFTDQIHLKNKIENSTSTLSDAAKARDILGLIDTEKDAYMLSLKFKGEDLKDKVNELEISRPVFSSLGNKRFAVFLDKSDAAENAYKENWGMTVDLAELAKGKIDIAGVPERISIAIPVEVLKTIRIDQLGWILPHGVDEKLILRGKTKGVDDDEKFSELLSKKIAIDDMKNYLLGCIHT